MSDVEDEEQQQEEEHEEEETYEAEEAPKHKVEKRQVEPDEGGRTKTEGELAMLAQKRKQEDEDEAKLAQYEEQRRIQREKEEEELRLLKEKQERRKAEREEEDRIMAERKREEEERRRQEDEERRAKIEAEKRKKEEDKRRRQELLMTGLQMGAVEVTEKRDKNQEKFDKFGNIVKAKAEMGFTKEQHEDQKRRALAEIVKPIDFSEMDTPTLKSKIKELHTRLCRLEGDKYDLEDRHTRQVYDLKELNERQRQINRAKALKKGVNPDDVSAGPHPPKVPVVSKYDRQIDRRSFKERRAIYSAPRTYPHFPNVPPIELELVKQIKGETNNKSKLESGVSMDADGGEGEDVEVEEEEEEE